MTNPFEKGPDVKITWMVGMSGSLGLPGPRTYAVIEADSGDCIAQGIANMMEFLPRDSLVLSTEILKVEQVKRPDAEVIPLRKKKKK